LNSAAPSGLGFAVLVREGMAAWMRHCAEFLAARPHTETLRPVAEAVLPDFVRNEVVQILTAMAMGCFQEARA
jgi:hypothetical protein